jgi:glucosamine-6-phosphate deaminase
VRGRASAAAGRNFDLSDEQEKESMEIVICKDYDAMSKQAADAVAEVVRNKPNCVLGLATGTSPIGLYTELIRMHKEEGLDFSQVSSFNLDEYVGLPPEHEQSYRYFMNKHLFDGLNIDKANTHVPSGTATDYAAHCQEYEDAITAAGGVDVQVLGIGSDGHVGFNEPSDSLCCRTHTVTLTEQTIDDNARLFEKKEDVPLFACTMGVGTVMDARKCVMVVNGKHKAATVARAFEGPVSCMCTASALQMHNDTHVFLDDDAAGELQMADYYRWIQKMKDQAPT